MDDCQDRRYRNYDSQFVRRPPQRLDILPCYLRHVIDRRCSALFNPIPTENYPAAERLAELIALPLIVVILYRQVLGSPPPKIDLRESDLLIADAATPTKVTPPFTVPLDFPLKPRPTLTPQAASALAAIALSDEETLFHRVTEAVGKTMLADITLVFASPDDTGSITCVSGYDLIREITLPKFTLASKKINTLVSAIQRGRPLRMRLEAHRSNFCTSPTRSVWVPSTARR